jgi:hypothetical protein
MLKRIQNLGTDKPADEMESAAVMINDFRDLGFRTQRSKRNTQHQHHGRHRQEKGEKQVTVRAAVMIVRGRFNFWHRIP